MVDKAISHIMQKAQQTCDRAGVKLTDKRKRVLSVLLASEKPLSAYEIADEISRVFETTAPPMSVYRMLDFLVQENLAHKLNSENKFIACSHIACDHSHNVPQFLICNQCNKVTEVGVPKDVMAQLSESVSTAGYSLLNSQLELPCLCHECGQRQA